MTEPMDSHRFRHTMSHLPTAVTVVTARDQAGAFHGLTVSAVTSLSLQPPMLLVCIDHDATVHDLLVNCEFFGVHVLAENQDGLARRFAERDQHRFEHHGDLSPFGLPLLAGAVAHIDAQRGTVLPGGDHSIITAAVAWSRTNGGAPLIYNRSAYAGLKR